MVIRHSPCYSVTTSGPGTKDAVNINVAAWNLHHTYIKYSSLESIKAHKITQVDDWTRFQI